MQRPEEGTFQEAGAHGPHKHAAGTLSGVGVIKMRVCGKDEEGGITFSDLKRAPFMKLEHKDLIHTQQAPFQVRELGRIAEIERSDCECGRHWR